MRLCSPQKTADDTREIPSRIKFKEHRFVILEKNGSVFL